MSERAAFCHKIAAASAWKRHGAASGNRAPTGHERTERRRSDGCTANVYVFASTGLCFRCIATISAAIVPAHAGPPGRRTVRSGIDVSRRYQPGRLCVRKIWPRRQARLEPVGRLSSIQTSRATWSYDLRYRGIEVNSEKVLDEVRNVLAGSFLSSVVPTLVAPVTTSIGPSRPPPA